MIISVNWLKQFVNVGIPVKNLVSLIGSRLVEVEGVEEIGLKYKDVLIVKVVECAAIEGTDHLNLTKIDDAGAAKDVERDASGLVQVVCGAPNVRAGMLTAWLPPKSIVPETFNDKEPFVLASKDLRGHKSNGMLASVRELDLYDGHDGILEIDPDQKPGASFADAYELNDTLLDIENKSLTHRPDTFGVIGFAREVAGIQGKQFKTPEWLLELDPKVVQDGSVEAPKIVIDDPELSDRFEAIVLSGADEKAKSPLSIQTYLARSGIRPISAVVDVTNYMMLLTGQPLHAYDYDKVIAVGGKPEIHVRAAKKGETLKLLDGKTVKLHEEDIVIAAGETAIGLGGAMGGYDTEIDDSTKRILLECATFNLYKLRNMQMRHGIFTEAITRLTKGVPAPLGRPVLVESADMICKLAGAKISSPIGEAYPGKHDPIVVSLKESVINETLGTQFAAEDIKSLLENVEFSVVVKGLEIAVTVPYWRHDIRIPEDIIEEVGRLSGFDSINLTSPARDFTAVEPDDFEKTRSQLRRTLVQAGANEVLTYTFVHGDIKDKVGQKVEHAYRLVNSLSPELQYYRQSLTPSLLNNIHPNIKSGFDHFALFEFNKFHTKLHELTDENVPKEVDGLAFVLTRAKAVEGAAFYEVKQYLEYIASQFGLEFEYEPLEEGSDYPVTQPFEPKRSARIWDKKTRERIGVVGEYKRSVQKSFKLPDYTAGFEIAPRSIQKLVSLLDPQYKPLSRFPGTQRDICFQVELSTAYQSIIDAATNSLRKSDLLVAVEPVDFYQPEPGETKNITIRVSLTSYDHTLSADEANHEIEKVIKEVVKAVNGKVV